MSERPLAVDHLSVYDEKYPTKTEPSVVIEGRKWWASYAVNELEQRIAALEAALEKYGIHMGDCEFWDEGETCSCGWIDWDPTDEHAPTCALRVSLVADCDCQESPDE